MFLKILFVKQLFYNQKRVKTIKEKKKRADRKNTTLQPSEKYKLTKKEEVKGVTEEGITPIIIKDSY